MAGILGSIIGMGLAMGGQKWQQKQQLEQQKELQGMQIEGAKEMGAYNQGLALDLWNKTNYEAQRKHMENAGLNVGLMYGMGGGGGASTNSPTGNVTGATASQAPMESGMGLTLGLAVEQAAANISKTKAEEENIRKDTELKGGQQGEIAGRIALMASQTNNETLKNEIMTFDRKIKEIESNIAELSMNDVLETITAEKNRLEGVAEQEKNAGRMSTEEYETNKKLIEGSLKEQGLRISAQKLGLIKTGAEIKQIEGAINKVQQEVVDMIAQRGIKWYELEQKDREIIVKQAMQKVAEAQQAFNTSTPAQIKQWTSIIGDWVPFTGGGNTGTQPAGFKY